MNCPNCQTQLERVLPQCPHCGYHIEVYIKMTQASYRLYNQGLRQAQERDMQGAVNSLEKSLSYYKKNTLSRNLLGLVYCEIGHIGMALKHWLISTAYEKNGKAESYIQRVKSNPQLMEQYNDGVKMYNQALVYARQNSEDMAVIQLKKAVELNPKLSDAYNLLALCYIYGKRFDLATPLVNKALAIDARSRHALNLRKAMNLPGIPKELSGRPPKKTAEKRTRQPEANTGMRNPYTRPVKRQGVFPLSEVLSFLGGLACTAGVIYFLLIPGMFTSQEDAISSLRKDLTALQSKYDTDITNRDEQIGVLTEANEQLASWNETLESQQAAFEKVQNFNQALSLNASGRQEEAAVVLKALDVNDLPEDYQAQYHSLTQEIYPVVARGFYDKGLSNYNGARYEEAKYNFESSVNYGIDGAFLVDCYYYLGRIAEIDNDIEAARGYYQKLVDDYGNFNQTRNARNRLNNLQ